MAEDRQDRGLSGDPQPVLGQCSKCGALRPVLTQQLRHRNGARFQLSHSATVCAECGSGDVSLTESVNIFEIVQELLSLPDDATVEDAAQLIEGFTPWLKALAAWIRGQDHESVEVVLAAVAPAVAAHYMDPSGISVDQMNGILREVRARNAASQAPSPAPPSARPQPR